MIQYYKDHILNTEKKSSYHKNERCCHVKSQKNNSSGCRCYIRVIGAVKLVFIWLLVETVRAEHTTIDISESIYMSYLLDNDEETLGADQYKSAVAAILEDDPGILTREPVIFLANPGIKPVIAEILAEDMSLLEKELLTIKRNPDLLEIDPQLKAAVEELAEQPNYKDSLANLVA